MEWKGRRQSARIEDRRGSRGTAACNGVLRLRVILAIGWDLGIAVTPLPKQTGQPAPTRITAADEERGAFVAVVLADTETIRSGIFESQPGCASTPPTLP